MKATNTPFDFSDVSESLDRMKAILDATDGSFEERDSIPSADALTFDNGFYVKCTALFIDIRGSSKLPDLHTRPVLAKIYRAYISECVAVLNSVPSCREVFINGDCVSAVLDTPLRADINGAFDAAAQLNSLVQILNWQLEKKGYTPIQCGIGLAYGRALMLKAGFKGYAINDIVWMGDVLNEASNLCKRGSKDGNAPAQVSSVVYNNLTEKYQGFLTLQFDLELPGYRYEGHVVNIGMDRWFTEQKDAERRSQELPSLLASLFNSAPRSGVGLLSGLGAVPQVPPPPSSGLGLLGGLGALPRVPPQDTPLSLADFLNPQAPTQDTPWSLADLLSRTKR